MIHRQKDVKCEVRKKSVSAKERMCDKRRGKNERTVVGRGRLGRDERGCEEEEREREREGTAAKTIQRILNGPGE